MKDITNRIINGFGVLLIVPVLSVLMIGLLICSIIVFVGGILRTFGMTSIQMKLGKDLEIPQILSLPVGIVGGLLFLAVAVGSWKVLKTYLSFVRE